VTDPELWIGLADVAPAEANTDEQFDGYAGGYVHALALAEDEDDFVERVRTALDELDLELLDLEDAEPVAETLERSGLSDELVALAIEAARTGQVTLGTFHLYPWEDDDGGAVAARTSLAAALESESLVSVACSAKPDSAHNGFVVGLGAGWVLLHWLDPSIRLNGYIALPLDDVDEVTVLTADDSVAVPALELRGIGPVPVPQIALDELPSLLASIDRGYPLVTIHREWREPDVFVVGRVAQLGEDSFILRHVTAAGRWGDSGGYRYDDVTRVDFGGDYEDALALVAGPVPT